MEKGLVDLAKLRKQINKAPYEGKSSFGFKIGDKFVKIYAREEDGFKGRFVPPDVKNITKFNGFVADTIVFPEEYIYENEQIAGEIANFTYGKRFDIALNTPIIISRMMNSYDNVINDLYLYADINMEDVCYVNILYSNRYGFYIIDTTDWKFQKDAVKTNIYRFNMSVVSEIMKYFHIPYKEEQISPEFLDKLDKYGKSGMELKNVLIMTSMERYSLIKFIIAYQNVYRIHYGEDAKTLKDVKELTKVIKKG